MSTLPCRGSGARNGALEKKKASVHEAAVAAVDLTAVSIVRVMGCIGCCRSWCWDISSVRFPPRASLAHTHKWYHCPRNRESRRRDIRRARWLDGRRSGSTWRRFGGMRNLAGRYSALGRRRSGRLSCCGCALTHRRNGLWGLRTRRQSGRLTLQFHRSFSQQRQQKIFQSNSPFYCVGLERLQCLAVCEGKSDVLPTKGLGAP